MRKDDERRIAEPPVPTPVKISFLWAALMSLYIYNDYFVLFTPGAIDAMASGSMGPLGDYTDAKMIAVAIVLAIPASMIFLSVTLPAAVSRVLNVVASAVYLIIAAATLIGAPTFYRLIVGCELVALVMVLRLALKWPGSNGS